MVDPHGSLGGPLRVSCNQLSELKKQGHDVLLVAAAEGYRGRVPREYCGIPVKLFAARRLMRGSFAGVSAPGLIRWLVTHGRTFDVAHIHMARDLVTLPSARLLQLLRVPTVLQTHGMIDPSSQKLAKPLDALMTRPTLRAAKKILALTSVEWTGCGQSIPGQPRTRCRCFVTAFRCLPSSPDRTERLRTFSSLLVSRNGNAP